MSALQLKQKRAALRTKRIRGKLFGTSERPRLTVFRSNKNTYLQVINDEQGKTIAAANDLMLKKSDKKAAAKTKMERTVVLAEQLVEKLKSLKVSKLCFDRGSYRYHGRLKTIAEAMRAAGIQV
jgi:large subunit ribosomal protein L18